MNATETIKQSLDENGYDYAVAIATDAEVQAGAACGQLCILEDEINDRSKNEIND